MKKLTLILFLTSTIPTYAQSNNWDIPPSMQDQQDQANYNRVKMKNLFTFSKENNCKTITLDSSTPYSTAKDGVCIIGQDAITIPPDYSTYP